MEITKELLEKRRAQLQAMFEQTVANANAIKGAIQEVDTLLTRDSMEIVPQEVMDEVKAASE